MSMVCITNDMPDVRSCTIKGEHQIICDDLEYRWSEKREQLVTTGRACTGCLPREARKGMLCWSCWDGVETAVAGYHALQQRLAGIDRAVQPDNGGIRGSSLGYIPIAAVPLMLEELASYLRGASDYPEVWVSSTVGAKNAVRFARAFKSAARNHPTEEVAHRIKRTRCPECRQLGLQWNPPNREGASVTVTCQNTACGHIIDQVAFERIAAIEKPCCRYCSGPQTCTDLTCRCHDDDPGTRITDPRGGLANERGDFATPFDPNNPQHKELVEEAA